jgi:hypothetical protein
VDPLRIVTMIQEGSLILSTVLRRVPVVPIAFAGLALLPLRSEAAVPQAPMGRIESSAPEFTWTGDGSALEYELLLSAGDPDTTHWVKRYLRYAPAAVCQDLQCGVTVPIWFDNGDYEWSVRPRFADGLPGDWTGPVPFSVDVPGVAPSAPVVLAPTGTGVYYRPSLAWAPVPGAVEYEFDVVGGDRNTFVRATDACDPWSCVGLYRQGLFDGGNALLVRARSAGGVLGPWSPVARYVVSGSPQGAVARAPLPLAPSGRVPSARPTFRWRPVPGAVNYHLRVYHGAEERAWMSTVAPLMCDANECAATLIDPIAVKLGDRGPYRWRVRAVGGDAGPYSKAIDITLPPPSF